MGGNIPAAADLNQTGAADGRMGLRLFGPCLDPNGVGEGCTVFEDLDNLKLAETRWYTSTARIFDGSLVRDYLLRDCLTLIEYHSFR